MAFSVNNNTSNVTIQVTQPYLVVDDEGLKAFAVGVQGPPAGATTNLGGLTDVDDAAVPTNSFIVIGDGTKFVTRGILGDDLPTGIDAAKLANGSVSNAEFQYLDGVTSPLQTQVDGKAATTYVDSQDAATLGTANTNAQGYATTAQTNAATRSDNASNLSSGTVSESLLPTAISANKIADGSISNAEFQYLDGVTSGIQGQFTSASNALTAGLATKADISHVHSAAAITSGTLSLSLLSGITTTQLSATADILGTQISATAGIVSGQITSLDASKLTGTVDNARLSLVAATIPALDASKITTGTLDVARLNGGDSTQFVRGDGTYSNTLTGGLYFQTNGTEVASIDNLGQFRGKSIAGGWSLTQSVLMTANAWTTVTNLVNITINPATTAFMPNMATGQIVIPMTGNYRVSYSLDLRWGSSGLRWAAVFVNGISPFLVGKSWIDIALDTSQIVNIANSGMTFLYAGSTVELRAYHNGPNDLYAYNAYSQMTIEYLGGY